MAGSITSITAASPQDLAGTRYAFESWSDGGAASHSVAAGTTGATYTATYRPISADLSISGHSATSGGGRVTLNVQTTNRGPVTATDVVILDTLASKLSFVSAAGCTWAATTRTVSCPVGSLASGGVASRQIVASYKGKGNAENVVRVQGSTPDANSGNDSSRLQVKLQ
jgi:uncharacterized repeat protein (TIGR01451 family)